MNKFPSEVNAEICLFVVDSAPRRRDAMTSLCLVSRHLKKTLYREPRLWTTLDVTIRPDFKESPENKLVDWVLQYFSRSGCLPLHLSLKLHHPLLLESLTMCMMHGKGTYKNFTWPDLSDIRAISPRIRTLTLEQSKYGTGPMSDATIMGLVWNWDILESLKVHGPDGVCTADASDHGNTLPRVFSPHMLPHLRNFDLVGSGAYSTQWVPSIPWNKLIRLSLTSVDEFYLNKHVFSHCKDLEELTISSEDLGTSSKFRSNGTRRLPMATLPKLRRLCLRTGSESLYKHGLLRAVRFPVLESLELSIIEGDAMHFDPNFYDALKPSAAALLVENLRSLTQSGGCKLEELALVHLAITSKDLEILLQELKYLRTLAINFHPRPRALTSFLLRRENDCTFLPQLRNLKMRTAQKAYNKEVEHRFKAFVSARSGLGTTVTGTGEGRFRSLIHNRATLASSSCDPYLPSLICV